jgi:2-oxoglutarate dehydrogenase E2 component (dihydrolipoamide succinyltransferase)
MIIEIRIPSPGESVSEVEIASWLVKDGDFVEKDQEIAEIESDKATLPLVAQESGKLKIKAQEGDTVEVNAVVGEIDTEQKDGSKKNQEKGPKKGKESKNIDKAESAKDPKEETVQKEGEAPKHETEKKEKNKHQDRENGEGEENTAKEKKDVDGNAEVKITPVAGKMMQENNLNVDDIINGLRRITSTEVQAVMAGKKEATRNEQKDRMSKFRKKLSERMVAVKNETAMLTTFNEINMGPVMELRKKYQKAFIEKHGIKLGFMSFFTKAVTEALKLYPKINSRIEGDEIVIPEYCDIGIAVQTEKGLMVPVLRNTETMDLADIEHKIAELADKARKNRIGIDDMKGGTFSITNGGVFGSLLSTPLINPPQTAILGMHNILERPIAVNGKVEIHPMMYVALSYDHRLIDGKDSVTFLVKLKELIESPYKMMFNGKDPEQILLGL